MQSVFQRYEKKYLVSQDKAAALKSFIMKEIKPLFSDSYFVHNIYYDTENWDIIRACVEKPLFKEKLRLRCYESNKRRKSCFLEIKRKFKGLVNKRRTEIPLNYFSSGSISDYLSENDTQIAREIEFYIKSKAVRQRLYLGYKRTSFYKPDNDSLRITFDSDLCFSVKKSEFFNPSCVKPILDQDNILLEIKTTDSFPLPLAHFLSENYIFPVGFSKYGVCYTRFIMKQEAFQNKPDIGGRIKKSA